MAWEMNSANEALEAIERDSNTSTNNLRKEANNLRKEANNVRKEANYLLKFWVVSRYVLSYRLSSITKTFMSCSFALVQSSQSRRYT